MKLIAGLGNPGVKYINTRHNIGFRVIDELARRKKVKVSRRLFGSAKEAEVMSFDKRLLLLEPLVFMNLCGTVILRYVRRFKVLLSDLLIVCDDINLPVGEVRIRRQGSSGGHNGLESVIESLKTETFARLKLGIGLDKSKGDISKYVLSDFNKDETPIVLDMILRAADCCESWVKDGIEKTMNRYNNC